MEKRAFLAIVLSIFVLLAYNAFVAKVSPPLPPPPTMVAMPQEAPRQIEIAPEVAHIMDSSQSLSQAEFETDKYKISFAMPQAAMHKTILKDYNYTYFLKNGLFLHFNNDLQFVLKETEKSAIFKAEDKEKIVTKTFNFDNSNYNIKLGLNIRNITNVSLDIPYQLILGTIKLDDKIDKYKLSEILVFADNNALKHINLWNAKKEPDSLGKIQKIAFRDRYFCFFIKSSSPAKLFINKINDHEAIVGLNIEGMRLASQQESNEEFSIYLGPQSKEFLGQAGIDWNQVQNFGFFDSIAKALISLLQGLHKITFNWGFAIIALSVVIFLIFYPFTAMQMKSMKRMQEMQPHIDALRKQLKDNPQKLNKEIMALYKNNKINPFSGCLPLILQAPIFFALYQVLMRSFELRGAKFFLIKDLSEPDKLIRFPSDLPFLGNYLNVLPILMAVTMFFQQKMSMKTAAATQSQEQQKIMLIMMPVIFGFLFYSFPSGLTIYWFMYSLLSLIVQKRTTAVKINP